MVDAARGIFAIFASWGRHRYLPARTNKRREGRHEDNGNLAFMAYNYYAETGGSAAMCKAPRGCQGRKESKKRVKQLPEGIQT